MDGVVEVMWRSRKRGIIVDVDVLSCGPHNVKPVLEGFDRVSCNLLGSWGDIRLRIMVYML